jgi:hypothetical protein
LAGATLWAANVQAAQQDVSAEEAREIARERNVSMTLGHQVGLFSV